MIEFTKPKVCIYNGDITAYMIDPVHGYWKLNCKLRGVLVTYIKQC